MSAAETPAPLGKVSPESGKAKDRAAAGTD